MPHDEEQVRQLVRQMYQSAEEARWELEPEQVRAAGRRRRFHWPEAKVLVLVGTAAALIVIGLAVAVGSGTHSSTPKRVVASPTTTAPTSTSLPRRHSTVPPATAPPTGTSPTTTVPATQSAQLSVVTCPTAFGYPTPTPASLPTSVAVDIPRSLSGQLSVYSDTQGQMKVVAPSGWTCQALLAADGSAGEVVTAPGETVPATWGGGWPLSPDSTVEAITVSETSRCAGCTVSQACPLFTAAVPAYVDEFGHPCTSRPTSEAVQEINPDIVSFEDPPAVFGDNIPSGGRYPSNGVMTYYPVAPNGSWLESCTLPTTEKDLCTTTLNTFIGWYGQD